MEYTDCFQLSLGNNRSHLETVFVMYVKLQSLSLRQRSSPSKDTGKIFASLTLLNFLSTEAETK